MAPKNTNSTLPQPQEFVRGFEMTAEQAEELLGIKSNEYRIPARVRQQMKGTIEMVKFWASRRKLYEGLIEVRQQQLAAPTRIPAQGAQRQARGATA
jgi:hypothetical protein